MRRGASLVVVAALLVPPVAAQDSTAVVLLRAREHYERLDLERALPLLRQLVSPQWSFAVTPAQRVEAHVYLAAALVLVGQRDSAVSSFAAALAGDPFTDLDPLQFTPAQIAAFGTARRRVFAVGARPVSATRADPRTERIAFTVTTTQAAALDVLLQPLATGASFPIFAGESEGVRDVAWDGLVPDGQLAPPGRYVLLVVARSRALARADSTRRFFELAHETVPLEDTLPDIPPRARLPERTGGSRARRELLKGAVVAAGAVLASRLVASRDLGGGQHRGTTLIAGAAVGAGAAGFLIVDRQRDSIAANIAANQQRIAERQAANEAIRRRNADRLRGPLLVVTPVAGARP